MRMFGLLGRHLGHSFSRRYFREKFARLGLADHDYLNFELPEIGHLDDVLAASPELVGLNVTIPYKAAVIAHLDEVRGAAAEIGAVNTIDLRGGRRVGYNTDVIGFELTLKPFLPALLAAGHEAIVLGSGGAAAAVQWVLAQAGLAHATYTRAPGRHPGARSFETLGGAAKLHPRLFVNTTPVGTHPHVEDLPPVPIELIDAGDVVIDLIYNPAETRLLREAAARGARTANGGLMLREQAEAAWAIWNA